MSTSPSLPPVVVTGGAGAIGSPLAHRLYSRGHEVRVIDNLSAGREALLRDLQGQARFRFHLEDVRNTEAIAPVFSGVQEVWHLAANADVRKGAADPRIDFEQGSRATFSVLECARRADVPRFFYSSSSVVYGFPTVFPTPETYGPLFPQSQYAASKLAAEGMVSAYCHSYGLHGWIFRFANIIGPGMTHGVIFDFLTKLRRDPTRLEVLGDGRQAKSYLWLDDCVAGLLLAADRAKETVNLFNLGTADRIPVATIAERVVAALGGKARIEYTGGPRGWVGDVPQQLLDTGRMQALGWKPRYTSLQAVDATIAALRPELGL
jgi:UDP-glucose 4-epimerase